MDEIKANSDSPISCLDTYARNPLILGLLVGVLVAVVQGLLISAGGPEAYGFCVACHTRDIANAAFNSVAGTKLPYAPISQNAILPVLTVIGVLIGAFISAKFYKEFKTKTASAGSYIWYLLGGLFFMVFALFMGGCPYRTAIRVGYGDAIAFIGLLAIIAGVLAGIKIATVMAEREV